MGLTEDTKSERGFDWIQIEPQVWNCLSDEMRQDGEDLWFLRSRLLNGVSSIL